MGHVRGETFRNLSNPKKDEPQQPFREMVVTGVLITSVTDLAGGSPR
jgi:hypothetical protein